MQVGLSARFVGKFFCPASTNIIAFRSGRFGIYVNWFYALVYFSLTALTACSLPANAFAHGGGNTGANTATSICTGPTCNEAGVGVVTGRANEAGVGVVAGRANEAGVGVVTGAGAFDTLDVAANPNVVSAKTTPGNLAELQQRQLVVVIILFTESPTSTSAETLGRDDLELRLDAQGRVVLTRGTWELATLNTAPPFVVESGTAAWMAAPLPSALPPKIPYWLVANGNSAGKAFDLYAEDLSGQFKKVVLPDGIVLEPAAKKAPPLKPASQTGKILTRQITAFCLQFAMLPPAAGMLYKIADAAAQRQYKPAAYVLEAGYKLGAAGKLNPDSDPKAYIDFIRQYAVWAWQEHWNEQQFTPTLDLL